MGIAQDQIYDACQRQAGINHSEPQATLQQDRVVGVALTIPLPIPLTISLTTFAFQFQFKQFGLRPT